MLGRSVYEIDVLDQADRRDLAIERLGEGATIPQMEAVLKLADGSTKAVVVAGQPIDMNDEACMLFTFMDLEPRKQAERALRQSEERFATAFRMAPVATAIVTADRFELLDVNDAFAALTGHAQDDLLGKSADEIGLWAERGTWQRIEGRLARDGNVRNADVQIRTREGDVRDCVVSADPVAIHGRDCLLVALLDISDRKRTEMDFVYAIETAMQDASWFSRTLIEKLANVRRANAPDAGAQLSDLTARERDVFDLLCHGLADKEIAGRPGLRRTPCAITSRRSTRSSTHSRGEAIVWARERGIVGAADANARAARRAARRTRTEAAGTNAPGAGASASAAHGLRLRSCPLGGATQAVTPPALPNHRRRRPWTGIASKASSNRSRVRSRKRSARSRAIARRKRKASLNKRPARCRSRPARRPMRCASRRAPIGTDR